MRVCSVEGCNRRHVARGLCMNHYKRERYSGRLQLVQRVDEGRGCSVEGCQGVHMARGLCRRHYDYSRRLGVDLADRELLDALEVLHDRGLRPGRPRSKGAAR